MVRTFPLGISLKVNALVQLEFELVYDDIAVQHVNHYALLFLIYVQNHL